MWNILDIASNSNSTITKKNQLPQPQIKIETDALETL